MLELLEYMADAVDIPILVDGDTGYGNFNNVRRLVRKLCERGIAGVCIEDKIFPKTNSFIGEAQPLITAEDGLESVRVIESDYLSTEEGRWETVAKAESSALPVAGSILLR